MPPLPPTSQLSPAIDATHCPRNAGKPWVFAALLAALGLVVLFGLAAVLNGHPTELVRALLGGVALGGGYLILAVLSRGQLGGGDVKLAGGLGIALGWLGWPVLLTGAAAGFVLMGVASVVLLLAGRITPKDSISFGPFMLAGALLTVMTST